MPRLSKFITTVVLFAGLVISVDPSQSADCSFSASSFTGPQERFIVFLNTAPTTTSSDNHFQWLQSCLNKPTQKLASTDFSTESVDSNSNQVVDFSVESKVRGYTAFFDAKFVDEHLSKRPEVAFVEKDAQVSINAAIPDIVQKNPTPNLDRIDQAKFPLNKKYTFPKSAGAGVTAYVVDTGVFTGHSEFEGRASFGAAVCAGCKKVDDNGHGSHVSGLIAGKTFGVAKKANIIGVKVLAANGSGTNADVVNGLMFVLSDHKKRKNAIVSMSLGGALSKSINSAVKALTDDGVHVVVAAGNDGADACKSSPSSERSAITVGATENTSDDITDFSNIGKCVDIFAPGRNILSVGINSKTDTAVFSGTSQATPHVSGTVALIISEKGNSKPADMVKTLTDLATKNILPNAPKGTTNTFLRVPK